MIPWGAQTRSRCDFVLVEHSSEEVAPPDVWRSKRRYRWRVASDLGVRRSQVECSMWTMLVEVADVDAQDVFKMARTEDEQPVEAFPAYAADPPLRVSICIRRADRGAK